MATQTSSSTGQKTSSKASARSSRRNASAESGRASDATSERDETYGLISVIYHSLQGAETCGQYIADARRAGNDELARFFEQSRDEQNRRALLGRRLLAAELEDVEEEVEAMLEGEDADT
jgi:hypothetical protein